MKIIVTCSDFHDAFQDTRPDNFTYAGLNALFEYLEEYEDSTSEEVALDIIALCCEYTEYEGIDDFNKTYNTDYENSSDITETEVVPVDNSDLDDSFIIQGF